MFFKKKLTWKRPLFYLLLPIFLVMAFLGFPLPVAPPPEIKARQEESAPVKKKKRLDPLFDYDHEDFPATGKTRQQQERTSKE